MFYVYLVLIAFFGSGLIFGLIIGTVTGRVGKALAGGVIGQIIGIIAGCTGASQFGKMRMGHGPDVDMTAVLFISLGPVIGAIIGASIVCFHTRRG